MAIAQPKMFGQQQLHSDLKNNNCRDAAPSISHLLQIYEALPQPQHAPVSRLASLKDQRRILDSLHKCLDRSKSEPARIPLNVNSSRYKTELCRPFEENGTCNYGDKCQFAHGMHELRNLPRHPKYKTELCKTFHNTAFCPYGLRCHFVHNADERVVPQLTRPFSNQSSPLSQSPTSSHASFFSSEGSLSPSPPPSQPPSPPFNLFADFSGFDLILRTGA